jgi:hypothetical protein
MTSILTPTAHLIEMAQALLSYEALQLRLFVQVWLREQPDLATLPQPNTVDPRLLVAAAALTELLAQRTHQQPPAWTAAIGALPEPFFVMRRAERPGFTRDLCLTESPEPLRRRNIFAPPNFLEMPKYPAPPLPSRGSG